MAVAADGKPWPQQVLDGEGQGREAGYKPVNGRTLYDNGVDYGYCTDTTYDARASLAHELKALNLMFASLMGLCLGVSMAFLQEFMDDRVNSPDDVERSVSLPVLGYIPMMNDGPDRLMTEMPTHSLISESYRGLRSAISFARSSISRFAFTCSVTSCTSTVRLCVAPENRPRTALMMRFT